MAQGLTCRRKGCESKRYAKGLCENHYRQHLRGVNPARHKPYQGTPSDHLGDDKAALAKNLDAIEAMMQKASAQLRQIANRVAYTREHLPDGDHPPD